MQIICYSYHIWKYLSCYEMFFFAFEEVQKCCIFVLVPKKITTFNRLLSGDFRNLISVKIVINQRFHIFLHLPTYCTVNNVKENFVFEAQKANKFLPLIMLKYDPPRCQKFIIHKNYCKYILYQGNIFLYCFIKKSWSSSLQMFSTHAVDNNSLYVHCRKI